MQDDFQPFNLGELTFMMTQARQAVLGRAYALQADRAIRHAYQATAFLGRAGLA
jgi:hypothetical protein